MKVVAVMVMSLVFAGCAKKIDETPTSIFLTDAGDEMILIPAGRFAMGSDSGEDDEKPVHEVEIDSFLIDRFEVKQQIFDRLEVPNPSRFKGVDHPVDNLTWVLAAQFCNIRSEAEKLDPCYDAVTGECDYTKNGYRLPTESEWEYACRAGTTTDYGFGSDPRKLEEFGWFEENSSKRTHPVGLKKPNAWGLHDMHGNVAEWCNDPYDAAYYASSGVRNPRGPADQEMYVVRGGSWSSRGRSLRSAARGSDRPGFGDACLVPDTLGMRCVRKAPAAR